LNPQLNQNVLLTGLHWKLPLDRELAMDDSRVISMSLCEVDRCKLIQTVVEDGLMVRRAAEKLGISRRQVEGDTSPSG
jgi:hypothetical protein